MSEIVSVLSFMNLTVFDTTPISEAIAMLIPILTPSVYDIITVTDQITMAQIWQFMAKHTSNWTNNTKHTSSWTFLNKDQMAH